MQFIWLKDCESCMPILKIRCLIECESCYAGKASLSSRQTTWSLLMNYGTPLAINRYIFQPPPAPPAAKTIREFDFEETVLQ